jgi:hypothetical protein
MRVGFLIMCAIVIMGVSCKKDSSGNIIVTKMSATIDGKAWDSAIRTTVLQATTNTFIITGTSLTGEILEVTTYGTTQGTYELSVGSVSAKCLGTYKASISSGTSDIYISTSGTVVLTKVDKTAKKISGTFVFSLYCLNSKLTKTVTNGVFNDLSYTEQ